MKDRMAYLNRPSVLLTCKLSGNKMTTSAPYTFDNKITTGHFSPVNSWFDKPKEDLCRY